MISTLSVDKSWQMDDALSLIRTLQPHVKPFGFHICLGGSVLNQGSSKKDLDLYFLPMNAAVGSIQASKLLAFLAETWGPGEPMGSGKKGGFGVESFIDAEGRTRLRARSDPEYSVLGGESCYTHKLKFHWSDLRIDVFLLGTGSAAKPAAPDPTAVEAPPLPDARVWTGPDLVPLDAPDALRDASYIPFERMRRLVREQEQNLIQDQQAQQDREANRLVFRTWREHLEQLNANGG